MANEYLKRTPTSTGNRKIFTYAGWFKKNNADGSTRFDIFNAYNSGSQQEEIGFRADALRYLSAGSTLYGFDTTNKYRDTGNWFHIVFALNTTLESQRKRSLIYINGVEVDTTTSSGIGNYVARNFDSIAINVSGKEHNVLARKYSSSSRDYAEGGGFDIFFVDGQALTPDVFGFHKDGDGYISVGSTQATDFRPGQWMPHSPTKIKKDINRRGGFGVNGFYLPMNDSSNPGADFHCAPNSIIKLKGEDLPQPRNGAPTTSDAYVSQVRKEIGGLGFAGCIKVDNYSGLVVSDHSNLDLGTGDYTIEGFYYIDDANVSSGYHALFDFRGTSGANGTYPAMFRHPNGHIYLYLDSANRINNVGFPTNEWTHVALSRSSGTTRLFVNGVEKGSFSDTISYLCRELKIGHSATQSNPMRGFISNFRVVKGTAVYTSNFTRPTQPLENINNTIVLMAQSATSATAGIAPAAISTYNYSGSHVFATTSELTGSTVLAVPGISTATGANLVTNGSFDSNVSGWTAVDATLTWNAGRAQTNRTGGSGYTAYQQITVVSGQRYTISGLIDSTGGGNRQDIRVLNNLATNGGSLLVNILGTDNEIVERSGSFTATGTTHYVYLVSDGGGTGFFDNIIVKQEDVPRDYSADIKGSGTNKTLTAAGNAGVGYELGNYYGSAINFPYAVGQRISTTSSDFAMGTGDFTVEVWINPDQVVNYKTIFATRPTNGPHTDGFNMWISATGATGVYSNAFLTQSANGAIVPNQWTHVVAERYNSQLTTYVNGVAAATATNTQNFTRTIASIGELAVSNQEQFDGAMQDVRVYVGVAKYKGGFDVPKPYTPVGIEAFRTTTDTCKNNFATLNSLDTSQLSATNGNLSIDQSSGGWHSLLGTHYVRSGKWYAEMRIDRLGWIFFGVEQTWLLTRTKHVGGQTGSKGAGLVYNTGNRGDITYNGTNSAYTGGDATAATGDIISIALDLDSNNVKFYKNNVLQYNLNNILESGADYTFGVSPYSNVAVTVNFGQNPSFSGTVTAGTNADSNGKGLFKYAPPSGFLALCEDNLPTPAIADPGKHFKTVLYSGDNSSGRRISDVGFQPDLVWVKARNATVSHILTDSVRGIGHQLSADDSGVEVDSGTFYLNSFADNGFDLGDGANSGGNTTGRNYVAWCWKAGGAAVSNSDGSITTQVSANQTAGFSIVKGTQTSGTTTFGHGLGKAPKMVITKQTNGTTGWYTYHKDIGSGNTLRLDNTSESTSFAHWVTDPTTSVFSMGSGFGSGETYVAYCFAEIEGYSKIGSYVGNQSTDGPFVYCGFKPAFLLVKLSSTTNGHWIIWDSSRTPTNLATNAMSPNNNWVETANFDVDLLSNGFKQRDTETSLNASGQTYIFLAFAESPFQTANAK